MKRVLIFCLFIICIISFSACSNNSNTNSSTDTQNSGTTTDTQDTSTQQSTANIVGDWKYKGDYEVELDLESNNEYELTVDQEIGGETEDSESQGTYVVDGNIIRLSIITVEDSSSYFTGTVVQNGQADLQYTLSDDGNTLTINNASDSIKVIPGEIQMTRS